MKFSSLLSSVVQLIGGDSSDVDVATFRFIRDMASHRLRLWWDAAQWPETVETRQESVNGKVFTLTFGGSDVLEVFDKDQRTDRSAKEVRYYQDTDGVHFLNDQETVFMKVKLAAPSFTGNAAAANTASETGVQYYYSGDFYNGVTGYQVKDLPQIEGTIQELPKRAANYLVRSVYADYLRSNNQPDAAAAEEANAEGIMNIELERFFSRKGQMPKLRVVRHGD